MSTAPASRGGRRARDKGSRFERLIVRPAQDAGVAAERIPLYGAAGGSFSGDVSLPLLRRDLCIEAKRRATGFSQLYASLDGRDALIVKADRRERLVILPLRMALEVAAAAERGKSHTIHDFTGAKRLVKKAAAASPTTADHRPMRRPKT
jgi:Holliday junction resolvase